MVIIVDNAVNNYEIEKRIDEIILSLEGREKKKKINEDEIYDPYSFLFFNICIESSLLFVECPAGEST